MKYGEYIFKATSQADDREATARGWKELVRCKECKFADVYYHGFQATDMFTRVCKKLVRHVETDGFCAWAERKEE